MKNGPVGFSSVNLFVIKIYVERSVDVANRVFDLT